MEKSYAVSSLNDNNNLWRQYFVICRRACKGNTLKDNIYFLCKLFHRHIMYKWIFYILIYLHLLSYLLFVSRGIQSGINNGWMYLICILYKCIFEGQFLSKTLWLMSVQYRTTNMKFKKLLVFFLKYIKSFILYTPQYWKQINESKIAYHNVAKCLAFIPEAFHTLWIRTWIFLQFLQLVHQIIV